jgi:hypothetical protein
MNTENFVVKFWILDYTGEVRARETVFSNISGAALQTENLRYLKQGMMVDSLPPTVLESAGLGFEKKDAHALALIE